MPELLPLSFLPLLFFALTAILNAFTFPRLRKNQPPSSTPFVSILIPMRNEATVIAATVPSLLRQNYPNFEILILDDNSTDDSAKIALQAAGGDPRLRIIQGNALPEGWIGKPWACHQLTTHTRADYLLFTDADVHWEADALAALMAESTRTQADLLTVWPTQISLTWGERLVVPLMALATQAYLPILAVHHLPWKIFAHAMGQCLLFKRTAYQQIGGHETVKSAIVDDMAFAYAIKSHKLRLRAADGNRLIQTRMYQNWPEVRAGFAKNILAGHGGSLTFLLLSTLFHWWLFVLPWLLVIQVSIVDIRSTHALIVFALLGVLTRALSASVTHQRVTDALLMPISVILMTLIAAQAIRWHIGGGPQWKGRNLKQT
jgi:chlorobactene glucosyltransferase